MPRSKNTSSPAPEIHLPVPLRPRGRSLVAGMLQGEDPSSLSAWRRIYEKLEGGNRGHITQLLN